MDNLSDYEKTAVMMDMLLWLAANGILDLNGGYSETEQSVLAWIRQNMEGSVNSEMVFRELDRAVQGDQ